ncbi:hypothetical protein [Desulfatitalea alkaliphila]|uniref:Tetratricopeptide repeat-containing protein n=1 Tax=Desulfatitalea alkaliphila TaxID=2929485 RepID=A0AA41R577_9BACT|nr:hypothetical protein [Desulfatitalea alkaliphila]MCJ8499433.1 hypothetical protein [Desulfatitalea alkaliphila]
MGKLTTVLAKKEAEAYLSQGLHQEAIKLYDQLLDASPHIDPAIKAAIENHRQKIEVAFQENTARKTRPLTAAEIGRIREGWGTQANESDILVCAQAFLQIGAHAEALAELRTLVAQAGPKKIYVHAMADCLAGLHPPDEIGAAVRSLARASVDDPKTVLAMQVAMAERLAERGHPDHARALFLHLAEMPALAAAMQNRLAALAAASAAPCAAANTEQRGAACARSPRRFGLERLRRLFGR